MIKLKLKLTFESHGECFYLSLPFLVEHVISYISSDGEKKFPFQQPKKKSFLQIFMTSQYNRLKFPLLKLSVSQVLSYSLFFYIFLFMLELKVTFLVLFYAFSFSIKCHSQHRFDSFED